MQISVKGCRRVSPSLLIVQGREESVLIMLTIAVVVCVCVCLQVNQSKWEEDNKMEVGRQGQV